VNHPEVTRIAQEAALAVVGEADVWEAEPMMGAEDFAILAREAPGAFLWVGAALPDAREHHHPRFDIDESVLSIQAALLARTGVALMEHFYSGAP
jgi:amidohydrolase